MRTRIAIAAFFISISLLGGIYLNLSLNNKVDLLFNRPPSYKRVFIGGAINAPGIYYLPEGQSIANAIETAKGFTYKADLEFIHKSINLSANIEDNQHIYIPESQIAVKQESSAGSNKININSASQKELETLPSIGEVSAKKIITNRPYLSLDDFYDKSGLSKKSADSLVELILL